MAPLILRARSGKLLIVAIVLLLLVVLFTIFLWVKVVTDFAEITWDDILEALGTAGKSLLTLVVITIPILVGVGGVIYSGINYATYKKDYSNNKEALWDAINTGQSAMDVKQLVKGTEDAPLDPEEDDSRALRISASKGQVHMVKALLDDGRSDPTAKKSEALRLASMNGHSDVVKALLHDGRADPSANKNEAIINASAKGYTEIVKLLLNDPWVDPSARNNYALQVAYQQGEKNKGVVELLLKEPLVLHNKKSWKFIWENMNTNDPMHTLFSNASKGANSILKEKNYLNKPPIYVRHQEFKRKEKEAINRGEKFIARKNQIITEDEEHTPLIGDDN